jgi:hypothetical protein
MQDDEHGGGVGPLSNFGPGDVVLLEAVVEGRSPRGDAVDLHISSGVPGWVDAAGFRSEVVLRLPLKARAADLSMIELVPVITRRVEPVESWMRGAPGPDD